MPSKLNCDKCNRKSRVLVLLSVCILMPVAAPSSDIANPGIKVDQVGYLPRSAKRAFLVRAGADSQTMWSLNRANDGKVVLQGNWTAPVFDPDSGDRVQVAEFSEWQETGDYYLDVPNVGRSWTFRIAPDVYAHAYYLTARSFYGQRCGTAVDLGGEFPGYRHGICHTTGAYDPSSGHQGSHVSEKGWHDAGDYGRYVVNSGISTATLMWAVELWGDGGMQKIGLLLPESGNHLPDLLNEVRWNIDWMLTMQDTDGGVWHKQTSAHFCGFVPPDKDTLPSLVIGVGTAPFKTSCSTADFAAVTAIAGRVFAKYDQAYAAQCLAASKRAWHWLELHKSVTFHNPPGIITGEYGDEDCADEALWAAAELARTTRASEFEDYFQAHYQEFLKTIADDEPPNTTNMGPFALWTYALGKGADKTAVEEIEARSVAAADRIAERGSTQPYRISMLRKNYVWGSNGVAGNYSLQLLIADRFKQNQAYVEAAEGNLHYLLGCNPLSLSYVTRLGSHSVEHIHHRPSAAYAQPWPGLLSGGPNMNRQDKEMQKLIAPDTPPARAYLDLQGSYASNEVAINWNAPLVFVLAALQGN